MSKNPDEARDEARRRWKTLFKAISQRAGVVDSSDFAQSVNSYLAGLGTAEQVTDVRINQFRTSTQKGGAALRVPQSKEMANAVVWALEDFHAWNEVDKSSRQEEQGQLLCLLGFEALPKSLPMDPPSRRQFSSGSGPFINIKAGAIDQGKDRVLRLLDDAAAQDQGRKVIMIFSSIGFETGSNPEVAGKIVDCLIMGVNIIYVIGSDWDGRWTYPCSPEHVKDDLKLNIQRIFEQRGATRSPEERKRGREKVYVAIEPPQQLPVWVSRFVRVGLAVELARELADSAALEWKHFNGATIRMEWIENTRAAPGAQLSLWVKPDGPELDSNDLTRLVKLYSDMKVDLKRLFEPEGE